MAMATASTVNFELTILDSVFTNNLRKQHKRGKGKCNELIKTIDSENASKEHLHDRISELIILGKIINKPKIFFDSHTPHHHALSRLFTRTEPSCVTLSSAQIPPPPPPSQ